MFCERGFHYVIDVLGQSSPNVRETSGQAFSSSLSLDRVSFATDVFKRNVLSLENLLNFSFVVLDDASFYRRSQGFVVF